MLPILMQLFDLLNGIAHPPTDLFSNSETGAKLQSKDGMFQPLHDYDSVFTEDMSPHHP